jgi:hypothetical protein
MLSALGFEGRASGAGGWAGFGPGSGCERGKKRAAVRALQSSLPSGGRGNYTSKKQASEPSGLASGTEYLVTKLTYK